MKETINIKTPVLKNIIQRFDNTDGLSKINDAKTVLTLMKSKIKRLAKEDMKKKSEIVEHAPNGQWKIVCMNKQDVTPINSPSAASASQPVAPSVTPVSKQDLMSPAGIPSSPEPMVNMVSPK